ncbi:trinucleotide repeat-containing gene 6A protein isoform X2 [Pleurodeles waltl]|uniref:trinucleotide repeat-containing gene 6A protein isoform X2 n=1 Tax=Pleurodeles waltl TaxID=8319 RepID=UPI003709B196
MQRRRSAPYINEVREGAQASELQRGDALPRETPRPGDGRLEGRELEVAATKDVEGKHSRNLVQGEEERLMEERRKRKDKKKKEAAQKKVVEQKNKAAEQTKTIVSQPPPAHCNNGTSTATSTVNNAKRATTSWPPPPQPLPRYPPREVPPRFRHQEQKQLLKRGQQLPTIAANLGPAAKLLNGQSGSGTVKSQEPVANGEVQPSDNKQSDLNHNGLGSHYDNSHWGPVSSNSDSSTNWDNVIVDGSDKEAWPSITGSDSELASECMDTDSASTSGSEKNLHIMASGSTMSEIDGSRNGIGYGPPSKFMVGSNSNNVGNGSINSPWGASHGAILSTSQGSVDGPESISERRHNRINAWGTVGSSAKGGLNPSTLNSNGNHGAWPNPESNGHTPNGPVGGTNSGTKMQPSTIGQVPNNQSINSKVGSSTHGSWGSLQESCHSEVNGTRKVSFSGQPQNLHTETTGPNNTTNFTTSSLPNSAGSMQMNEQPKTPGHGSWRANGTNHSSFPTPSSSNGTSNSHLSNGETKNGASYGTTWSVSSANYSGDKCSVPNGQANCDTVNATLMQPGINGPCVSNQKTNGEKSGSWEQSTSHPHIMQWGTGNGDSSGGDRRGWGAPAQNSGTNVSNGEWSKLPNNQHSNDGANGTKTKKLTNGWKSTDEDEDASSQNQQNNMWAKGTERGGSRGSTESSTESQHEKESEDGSSQERRKVDQQALLHSIVNRADLDPRVLCNSGWGQTPIKQNTAWDTEAASTRPENKTDIGTEAWGGSATAPNSGGWVGRPSSISNDTSSTSGWGDPKSATGWRDTKGSASQGGWEENTSTSAATGMSKGNQSWGNGKEDKPTWNDAQKVKQGWTDGHKPHSSWGSPAVDSWEGNPQSNHWGDSQKASSSGSGSDKSASGWSDPSRSTSNWGNSNNPNQSSTSGWGDSAKGNQSQSWGGEATKSAQSQRWGGDQAKVSQSQGWSRDSAKAGQSQEWGGEPTKVGPTQGWGNDPAKVDQSQGWGSEVVKASMSHGWGDEAAKVGQSQGWGSESTKPSQPTAWEESSKPSNPSEWSKTQEKTGSWGAPPATNKPSGWLGGPIPSSSKEEEPTGWEEPSPETIRRKMEIDDGTAAWGDPNKYNSKNVNLWNKNTPNSSNTSEQMVQGVPQPLPTSAMPTKESSRTSGWGEPWSETPTQATPVDNGTSAWGKPMETSGGWGQHNTDAPTGWGNAPIGHLAPSKPVPKSMQDGWCGEEMPPTGSRHTRWEEDEDVEIGMWNSHSTQDSNSSHHAWPPYMKKMPSKGTMKNVNKQDESWMNPFVKQFNNMGFSRDSPEEAMQSNKMDLSGGMMQDKRMDVDKPPLAIGECSRVVGKGPGMRPHIAKDFPMDRSPYFDKEGLVAEESQNVLFMSTQNAKLPPSNNALPNQPLGSMTGLGLPNLNAVRQVSASSLKYAPNNGGLNPLFGPQQVAMLNHLSQLNQLSQISQLQRLLAQQQKVQNQRGMAPGARQQQDQQSRYLNMQQQMMQQARQMDPNLLMKQPLPQQVHQSPGMKSYLDSMLPHSSQEQQKGSSPISSFSNFPIGLNSNLSVNVDMGSGKEPQSRLRKWTMGDNSMSNLSLDQNSSKHGAISNNFRLEDPPYSHYDFLNSSNSPASPPGSVGDGWSSAKSPNGSSNVNWPPEFRPGEPWKGYPNIDPETDPFVTPGSVINNLSINTVRDVDHLRDRNNGSSSSMNTTLPSNSAWSSIRASSYSVSHSSTAQSTAARNSDPKSTWPPGSASNTSLAHELWKVPLQPKNPSAPSRPPPGLTGQKPPLSTWDNNSLRLSGGWSNSDARYTPGSSWGESSSGRITNWLVLKNLTPQIDGSTLRTLCMQHGPLITFHLNLPHGNALVRYSSKEEVVKAQKSLHMCVLGNTTILAEFASDEEISRFFAQGQSLTPSPSGWQSMGSTPSRLGSMEASHSFSNRNDLSHWNSSGLSGTGTGDLHGTSLWGTPSYSTSLWGTSSSSDPRGMGSPSPIGSFLPVDHLGGESM